MLVLSACQHILCIKCQQRHILNKKIRVGLFYIGCGNALKVCSSPLKHGPAVWFGHHAKIKLIGYQICRLIILNLKQGMSLLCTFVTLSRLEVSDICVYVCTYMYTYIHIHVRYTYQQRIRVYVHNAYAYVYIRICDYDMLWSHNHDLFERFEQHLDVVHGQLVVHGTSNHSPFLFLHSFMYRCQPMCFLFWPTPHRQFLSAGFEKIQKLGIHAD